MKKLIIVALALATASTLSAQGLVSFSTTGGRVSFATIADGESAYARVISSVISSVP